MESVEAALDALTPIASSNANGAELGPKKMPDALREAADTVASALRENPASLDVF